VIVRFCSVFEYPTLNGGERSWLAMLPALRAAGWEVSAIAPAVGPLAAALAEAHVPLVGWGRDPVQPTWPLDQKRLELTRHLERLRPSVVHGNSLSVSRCLGPVAQSMQVTSMGHIRDIVGLSRQAVSDVNCNSLLIAVSAAVRQWHIDRGVLEGRVTVLHNGVDLRQFQPAPSGSLSLNQRDGLMHLPANLWWAGCVGQLGMRKGFDVLLEGIARVARKHEQVGLLVIGERNSDKEESYAYERALRERAELPDLRGRVQFLGVRQDVPELMPQLRCLVHTARQEPLGRVILEALACGVPVVATDVGGTREIFASEAEGGVLVPPDDPAAVAAALGALIADPRRCRQLGLAGRRNAESRFNAARVGEQFVGLVRGLTAS
jgi:glycosyltransferase involved in cell wall biosynthesis